jgi:hypothetical protein
MALDPAQSRAWVGAAVRVASLLLLAAPIAAADPPGRDPTLDVVGVAIVRHGEAILLAVRGIEDRGNLWRFRSLDTRDLPQPVRDLALAASGTKLFLDTAAGPLVLDLTREYRHNAPMQYVDRRAVATGAATPGSVHRLPSLRFVAVRGGTVRVIDDLGRVQSESTAVQRPLADLGADDVVVHATGGVAVGRFVVLSGPPDSTRIVDPEGASVAGPRLGRAEAALRARLMVDRLSVTDAQVARSIAALLREAPQTTAAAGEPIVDWRFFSVAPDEELYAPVLQVLRREATYPDTFETLEALGGPTPRGTPHQVAGSLLARYLRLTPAERRQRCTIYVRTLSLPGSWVIEYWFYYPFDLGGLGPHLHDPEHLFVEVDKLGGAVRRVIGAGHGYVAGNNIYSSDRVGALAIDLPLVAMVEFQKHATATDVDRDGIFTPGLDENEYRERAKVWGVRDVIGTINNELIAYDRTMTAFRFPEDALAPLSVATRFPHETAFASNACCRLLPLPDGRPELPACLAPTTECARRSVLSHPDARQPEAILKDWVFPHAFLRLTYGLGPREALHSLGIGYAVDLNRMPLLGRLMPLPGRVGGEVVGWHQDMLVPDTESCLADCGRAMGVGVGVRYEQFLSNLFGIYTAVRVYSPPAKDIWITLGPMVEVPILNRSNVNFQAGLSFRPAGSPRFEMKLSFGVWKPKTNYFGMKSRSDDSSHRSR